MEYTDEQMAFEDDIQWGLMDDEIAGPITGRRVPLDDPSIIFSDNKDCLDILAYQIKLGERVNLTLGFKDQWPYYEFLFRNYTKKIYNSAAVLECVMHLLEFGTTIKTHLNLFDVNKVEVEHEEEYILRRIKHDRERKFTTYNKTSGEYKAIYPFGTIIYGVLPYSTEELVEKLNQLK